jgi:predicted O-methyltransferase YrrM
VLSKRPRLRSATPATWVPPGHYYSPIPGDEAIEAHRRRSALPPPEAVPAVDLRVDRQLELLGAMRSHYPDQPFADMPQPGLRYYFDNSFFSYADAIFLYCLMREMRPKRVIEIGSGFSTAVMLDTAERFLDGRLELTCIDPYPQRLESVMQPGDADRVRLVRSPVQALPLDELTALDSGDILFIDSTHVAKTGSDVNFIVFEVLPRLVPGVVVHFHDILYPFDYPIVWVAEGRAWNEAYLLHAFLAYNETFEIVLFNDLIAKLHPEVLRDDFPLCTKNTGGSLWLRRR